MAIRQSARSVAEAERSQVDRLVDLLGAYASNVLTGRLLEDETGGTLTPSQFEALCFIRRHDGCSAKALSEGLRISIPSATRLVDRLVRKVLVDRRESGADRRLVTLTVTRSGEDALHAVHQARLRRLQRALAKLSPAERAMLPGLLERFLQAALCDERTVRDCCLHCGTDHDGACVVNEAHLALVGRPIDRP